MLLGWMLYAAAIAALCALGALAAERVAVIYNVPRRFVWLTAMLIAVAVPSALAFRTPARPLPSRRAPVGRAGAAVARPVMVASPRATARLRAYRWTRPLAQPARMTWMAGSTLVGLIVLVAVARIAIRRRGWSESKLSGHAVLVSDDVGPAVVGYLRPRIVIPKWALELGTLERRLMLHHELEHVSAEDPRLMLAALVLLVVFPWNVALWWMTHRLRLAIEIDCDSRVVQRCGVPREYGLFLLAVGERRSHPLYLAASLAERQSSLERRIRAMTFTRPRRPILAAVPFAAIALAATTLAAQTPTPPAAPTGGSFGAVRLVGTPVDRIQLTSQQVRALITAQYPGIAAGTSEDNTVTILLGPKGEVLASGASKAAVGGTVFRATTASGAASPSGGQVIVSASAASTAPAAPVSAPAGAIMSSRATASTGAAAATSSREITIAGIGSIDASLVRDMYWKSYEAGDVSANALRVRFVTLTSASFK